MILSEGRLTTDEIHALICRLFRSEMSMILSEDRLLLRAKFVVVVVISLCY